VRRRAACASESTAVASSDALSLASWNDENVCTSTKASSGATSVSSGRNRSATSSPSNGRSVVVTGISTDISDVDRKTGAGGDDDKGRHDPQLAHGGDARPAPGAAHGRSDASSRGVTLATPQLVLTPPC
jgi:hypothetical protein